MDPFFVILGGTFSTVISFIAGWLVATDKNRSELFKQKLCSYKKIIEQVSKVYTIGYSIDKINYEGSEVIYKNEASTLLILIISESIFIEKDILRQLYKFLKMKPEDYENNKDEINNIVSMLRKDLGIKNLNMINQLSSLEFDKIRMILKKIQLQ